jgi:hypothetical protein
MSSLALLMIASASSVLSDSAKVVWLFSNSARADSGRKSGELGTYVFIFSLRFFWSGMINPDVERYFPDTACILSPDRYEMAECIRLFRVTRFSEFRWPGRITEWPLREIEAKSVARLWQGPPWLPAKNSCR